MSHYVSHSSQHQAFVLTDFLEQDDLALLEEKPIVAEKDDKFRNFLRCQAGAAALASGCLSLFFAPSTCYCNRIFEGSSLVLSADNVEFSQPTPSLCVLANLKRSVPLENITDVTVEDDCMLQMFGLKKIMVQTAGTGGIPVGPGGNNMAGVQAIFVKEPELWKSAINHAHALKVQTQAPGGQAMSRKNASRAMEKSLNYRVESLRQLVVSNALTEKEADAARVGLMLQKDDLALTLLGIYGLKSKGVLSREDFEQAKKHFMATCTNLT
ncbi:hypothetical protein HOP50_03g20310 [Chloropicon primus]|uniref:Uncharacterized protein n=1 Tax=Chloropicon primus TaxID=1764295 RepID=A0A5B8MHE7_9CHLO|nr:hypothetical protein A3770_03p20320 [Chloropicon primus]UPQ98725.1 hypothetical protein HOP50_03g20310 [Chloropicon primus]|eukprot:QDZ19514.1 hypothetical protein A3770_03p20320 [Chloropicon primus]